MEKKRSVIPNGDAVRSARLRKAWTSDDLSRHTDCATKTIENAERGKAIYANTLARIASALGVDYDSLIPKPVEQKKPTAVEPKRPAALDPSIATARVETVFLILRRKDRPIDSDWFLNQLRSNMVFHDSIEVLDNRYFQSPLMPEGGVRIALLLTVQDFVEVFAAFTTKSITDLKVAFLTAANVPHPHIRDHYLWHAPEAWSKPPHSHLYD